MAQSWISFMYEAKTFFEEFDALHVKCLDGKLTVDLKQPRSAKALVELLGQSHPRAK